LPHINRALILFKYFCATTDEAHPVSLADISAHLKEHGITADPRTLCNDIEQLVEFGVDIVKDRGAQNLYRGAQNLYHVATRHFEAPEVRLLIDAVQSARFITLGKSKELVKRLTTFIASGDAALPERHLYIDSRAKAVNESIYVSVDRIQTAIAERKKIAFRYFDYSPSKERVHRNGEKVYSVSPHALLWNNDTYYLVGFHEHRQQIAKFRVDRIDGLQITQKAALQKSEDFDVSACFTQESSMHTGGHARARYRVRTLCFQDGKIQNLAFYMEGVHLISHFFIPLRFSALCVLKASRIYVPDKIRQRDVSARCWLQLFRDKYIATGNCTP